MSRRVTRANAQSEAGAAFWAVADIVFVVVAGGAVLGAAAYATVGAVAVIASTLQSPVYRPR